MPKPPKPTKTREQRVMDAIEILSNLKSVGATGDSGYIDTKLRLDQWIADGETWAGRIEFPRYGRYLDLILPQRADRKPACVLRAGEELKAQDNEK